MDFKRYLNETEFAATNPVAGDQFTIVVNEVVAIQTAVVESSKGEVTLKIDDKAQKVMEGVGIVFESIPSSHTLVAGRDFRIEDEYKGFVMGDESIDDDDGFTKYGYGVYKFVKDTQFSSNGKTYTQKHYRRVSDIIDPATGKEPSPYYKGSFQALFRATVDKLVGAKHASLGEGEMENFTADDIKDLESIRDLNAAKAKALQLISTQSKRAMKPGKVVWLKNALASKESVGEIIKLMYDLMLSGEGHSVIGTRTSMRPNSFRRVFGEDSEIADLRRLSGLGEAKTRRYVVVHLPNGQTTKRQFTIDASSDDEAKAIAATRMKDRPNSKLISVKHDKPLMHKPNLVGEATLREGYEDRVQAVANNIAQHSKVNSIKKADIDQFIPVFSRQEPEYKMKDNPSSKAWPDFVRDVKRALIGKVRYSNNSAAVRAKANNDKLAEIADIIEIAVGNAFPDGDPFDAILPKVSRRYNIDSYEVIDWLDKAAKKHLHAKNYHDYLRSVWQAYMDDNPGAYGLMDNPWTSESLEEDGDFIVGDRVRHKENGRIGRVVGYPEGGDEYPIEFDDEKGEAYYCNAPVLELVESFFESTIKDRIVTVTKELEAKKKQKQAGSSWDTKLDDKIKALTRELTVLNKKKPVTESVDKGIKVFALTNEGSRYINFSGSSVNILRANVSGSVALHQVVESVNKSTPWVCKVTSAKSAGSAFIPRG